MDENCLVSIKLSSQHCAIENFRESWEIPTVMGKPVGIVRRTIYNNHRTKYRLVGKSGKGGGGGRRRRRRRGRRRRRNEEEEEEEERGGGEEEEEEEEEVEEEEEEEEEEEDVEYEY